MNFTDLLALTLPSLCQAICGATGCLLIIGDAATAFADHISDAPGLIRTHGPARILFGLPILTLPYPVLVNSLMTERNTRLDQLSLFGWIEDNAILEPRAEVFGLTPLGDDPVLFIRDLDLDRAPECYLQMDASGSIRRVAGVIIAGADHTGAPATLSPIDGTLTALAWVFSGHDGAQALLTQIRTDVAASKDLRHILRARRRGADPATMATCDGWRVLARTCRFMQAAPISDHTAQIMQGLRLDALRRW